MTKDFTVFVSMNQAAPVKTGVVLKQGDFGFDLKITVLDFVVTGTTPQIVFRKPMGAVESTDVTASGNVYTYTFKGTELDTPGKVFCDLKLRNSTTQRISTASFQFECIADTLDGLAEESSSYSDTIAQIVGGFDGAIEKLDTTTDELAKNSMPWEEIESILENGVVNFKDGSVYNAGRHITVTVSSLTNKLIKIQGRSAAVSASVNYGLYAFYDLNDNLLTSFGTSYATYENTTVLVPAEAAKIIVNSENYSVISPKVYNVTETAQDIKDIVKEVVADVNGIASEITTINTSINGLTTGLNTLSSNVGILSDELSKVAKSSMPWEEIEGTLENGNVNFKDGSIYNSGKHLTVSVSSIVGNIAMIQGRSAAVSASVNYGLYALYDSNDNITATFGASYTTYDGVLLIIPAGTSKIVVNSGSPETMPPKVFSVDSTTADIKNLLDALNEYIINDRTDPNTRIILWNEPEYENGGIMDFKSNVPYGSTYGKKYTVEPGDVCNITGHASSVSSSVNYNLYGFYDSSMNLLFASQFPGLSDYSNIIAVAPADAAYCYVNGHSGGNPIMKIQEKPSIVDYINGHSSIWAGKKIGVLGTSVAFGQLATTSYSYEAAAKLGFDLKMFAVPGLAIEIGTDGTPHTYGSFTMSKAEYATAGWTIPDAPVTPYVPGGTYNNYYRTYENVFTQENADIDLWIYAVAPNNGQFELDDWNAFNKGEWKYNDNSPFLDHRRTFLGALLFIMNQMYTLNPNARMVLLLDSSFSYSDGKSNFEKLVEQWNIKLIDLWGKINICPPSYTKLKSEGGTNFHPSTFAHQIMGNMLSGELGLIS